jgi:serine/threonine-protein kinase HipA
MAKNKPLGIEVCASWVGLAEPAPMGTLHAAPGRGEEIFSFEYNPAWLKSAHARVLDPNLGLHRGPQYAPDSWGNFGVFLDSSPDRWGRLLMRRREAQEAREQKRAPRGLRESDYLLGVYDEHRMGALRFRLDSRGPFLSDNQARAAPPWTSLRKLEHASLQLERDDAERAPDYAKWLKMLIAPGGSLGGARPKASVVDERGHPWIAKFPSVADDRDVGAWESVTHELARRAGIEVPHGSARRFNSRHHTFMTKRFDRTDTGERIHFASAMTLLNRADGDSATTGASYLELVELIAKAGAQPSADLEQLWRRIVFFICVSNTDDHLRNHGFMLGPKGWRLAPAYDINPVETSDGLHLNISEDDNALDLDLALSVAKYFRLKKARAAAIIAEVVAAVKSWREVASAAGIGAAEQQRMRAAFQK